MNREPLSLYTLRLIITLGIFAFMGMIYWSSSLLEENLNKLRVQVSDIKTDISLLRQDLLRQPRNALTKEPLQQIRPHINPHLPNMLSVDPFTTHTLPEKLLPPQFKPKGTLKSAETGHPANLHPFNNLVPVPIFNQLVSDAIASLTYGKYEELAEGMAIKMEERVNPETGLQEFWVHLRDNLYWQPLRQEFFGSNIQIAPFFKERHPVTAEDFKLYVDAVLNPHNQMPLALAARSQLEAIEGIEVIDPLTFVVRWKGKEIETADGKKEKRIKYLARFLTAGLRPLASFVYKYFPNGKKIIEDDSDPNTYRTNSVWAQNLAQHWSQQILICCGPWFFESISDRELRLVRNPDHYNPYAALAEQMVIEFKDSPDAIFQAFKANQIDSYEVMPEKLLEMQDFLKTASYQQQASAGAKIQELDYVGRLYFYIGWNQANPLFKSAKVRRALTLAIDRKRIINQIMNGLAVPIHGTFYVYSKENDPDISPWPFDPQEAKRLLEEEGWFDNDGDGILDKVIDGKKKPFQFTLNYFGRYPVRKSICEFIATSLKEIGIICEINGLDTADYTAAFDDKKFDAQMMGWVFGTPPDDPKQIWYSAYAKEKGSSNFIGYQNAETDNIIDTLEYEYNPAKRLELYRRFDRIIYEECPYTFLYTPKNALFYRSYLKNLFIPAERQDLIPGATVGEPSTSFTYIEYEN